MITIIAEMGFHRGDTFYKVALFVLALALNPAEDAMWRDAIEGTLKNGLSLSWSGSLMKTSSPINRY